MRYVLKVCYDGTTFGGWQIQNNAVTVQQCLQEACASAFGQTITVTASGRTDAGVHAAGQIVHFDAELTIPATRIADALNMQLSTGIRVLQSAVAPADFNANRSAKRKTYCYRFYVSPRQNPLKDRFATWIKCDVDDQKLNQAARYLEGEHDFKAYCASGSTAKTTVRTVFTIEVKKVWEHGSFTYEVWVCGNGFLYNMVRTLVGTMLWYATDKLSWEQLEKTITERDRNCVGKTMPPQGLMLEDVDYGINLFD
jgi:tRNA pseudouridine38-40 synthase